MMDDDKKRQAMIQALEALESAMDDADGDRMKSMMAESMDEDSEQPIDPKNLDPEHTEAEAEGGHPGELAAPQVDEAESDEPLEDEDKKRLKALSRK